MRSARLLWLYPLPLAAVVAVSFLGPLPERMVPLQGILLLGGLGWLIALHLVGKCCRAGDASPALTLALVAGAVVLRMVALSGEPGLSDDVHRYAWEGALVSEGISPYAFAPDDPSLERERLAWGATWGRVGHRSVSAAYPPLAQGVFALVVRMAGGIDGDGWAAVRALRLLFTAADLGVLACLLVLLGRRGMAPVAAVAWGWSPLVPLECGGAGHFDVLAILLLVGALCLLGAGSAAMGSLRRNGVLAILAAGTLVKILPAVAVPFVLLRGRRIPDACKGLALFGGLVALGWSAPLLLEGGFGSGRSGLGEYGLRWESGSLVFRWVEPVFDWLTSSGVLGGFGAGGRDGSWADPRVLARGAVLLVWCGIGLQAWRRQLSASDAVGLLIATFLVLTPTLHPWYMLWAIPFLALRPMPALGLLVALVPLLYWPLAGWQADGVWLEPPWLWASVALPPGLLAILLWLGARGSRALQDSKEPVR